LHEQVVDAERSLEQVGATNQRLLTSKQSI